MEMRDYVIGFILVGLFAISLIAFGINLAEENSTGISISDDTQINSLYSGINDTIYDYNNEGSIQEKANSSYNKIKGENPIIGAAQNLFFASISFVAGSVSGISYALFGNILAPVLNIIIPGEDGAQIRGVILIVISTIMMLSLALLVWKLYRTGI